VIESAYLFTAGTEVVISMHVFMISTFLLQLHAFFYNSIVNVCF